MSFGLDQILPSLQSLGLWSYWIIGLASALEAFFITGVMIPGTLVVDAGGIMVERGLLDFFDLVWFVAVGSIIGGELSYFVGRRGAGALKGKLNLASSPYYMKAERLFLHHGGMALVTGRFLGPVSGLVPLAAALAGMEHKRFALWNAVGAIPYALAHVALGYFLGGALFQLGPFGTRAVMFGLGALLVLIVLWYLVVRIKKLLPFGLSVVKSMVHGVAQNPDVRAWAARHPRLSAFVSQRFDLSRFTGLSATLLGAVFAYILGIWTATVFDFIMAEPIVLIDTRLANLIHAFWNPGMLRGFAHVTALGDWRVVAIVFAGTAALLLLGKHRATLLGLSVALIGNVVSVAVLKAIFHRPRPELAYFVEGGGSFPSGHAAVSVAFYGMLFFVAWRQRFLGPVLAALMAVTLAFAIGLSRLYLIEHYLSDVLNGYLVGAMWLVIGIALAEWWRENHAPNPVRATRARAVLSALIVAGTFAGAAWVNLTYDKARGELRPAVVSENVADIPLLFTSGRLLPQSESIAGSPLEPISLIFVAKDASAFTTAMHLAGWTRAEKPGVASVARAAWAAWTNQQDAAAPMTPYFWQGVPNEFSFRKPVIGESLRKHHHARFWNTGVKTSEGAEIFVGTASIDDGLTLGSVHHMNPNIDAVRDMLVQDLTSSGAIARDQQFQLSTPRLGADGVGDPWFTDGKAVIVWGK